MRIWKRILIQAFARRDIYISRKYHPNDGTITVRISEELIRQAGGVLHIGAHEGQEASFYAQCNVPVTWIEALPAKYEALQRNIQEFPRQNAICALLGDSNVREVEFFISNNDSASSSIYLPSAEANVPFEMIKKTFLEMKRLDSLISPELAKKLKHWVVDVQGAELKVLEGAGELIHFCNSIIVEAKRQSNYTNGTTWGELVNFLELNGFVALWQIGENDEDNAYFIRVKNRLN